MFQLNNLKPARHSKKTRRIVGRGNSSGRGTYSGRGLKGQKARSGGKKGLKKKGIRQLLLKIPKQRGFRSIHNASNVTLTLGMLDRVITDGMRVTPEWLRTKKLLRLGDKPAIVVSGSWTHKNVTIVGIRVTAGARAAIEASGGKIE